MGLAGRYNHFAEEFIVDPYALWRRLREEEPVARAETHDGYYVVSRYEHIREAAADTERFSSANGTGIPPLPMVGIIPIDVDPPEQHEYRRIINPAFTAQAVAAHEPQVRAVVSEVLDDLQGRSEFDASDQLGMRISPPVALGYVGFDREDWPALIQGIDDVTRLRSTDSEATLNAAGGVMEICLKLLADRRASPPRGDLMDLILAGAFHGEPLSDQQVLLMLATLLVGAIDTTALAIASSTYYLATHPDHQGYLREHGISKAAVEEMVRWSSPVQVIGRTVTRDTELGGCPLHKDDRVLLIFASGNRQESVFENPDEMEFERPSIPHLGFGHGPHKCAGLNLGKLMLRVTLEELLGRTHRFELINPKAIRWVGGEIRGPKHVMIRAEWR
jgi:cytochrome P450